MSLEAVQKVTETEQKARARKAEAVEQAKKLIADAERQGRERLSAAKAEADAQVKVMLTKAEKGRGSGCQTHRDRHGGNAAVLRQPAPGGGR